MSRAQQWPDMHQTLYLIRHAQCIVRPASGFGRMQAEALTNPDVVRIERAENRFVWHRGFSLPGLAVIATRHEQTPRETLQTAAGETPGVGTN
jgi:hypothetical protein